MDINNARKTCTQDGLFEDTAPLFSTLSFQLYSEKHSEPFVKFAGLGPAVLSVRKHRSSGPIAESLPHSWTLLRDTDRATLEYV